MFEPDDGLLLGTQIGDKYILNRDTAMVLNSMSKKLNEEDSVLRNYRCQLAFTQVVKTDLIPILINCGAREDVFASAISLLVNLSVPMECLLSKELTQTRTGKQTIYQLRRNLTLTKEAFLDTKVARVILEHMSSYIVDKAKSLDESGIGIINNCLLLIRNVLHVPDTVIRSRPDDNKCSVHNHILWNLFRNNLDDALIELMGHANIGSWCNTMVQIIALIYKDQHVVNLQKLLQTFIDNTLSESSDNESNTSPHDERSNPADISDSLDSQNTPPSQYPPQNNSQQSGDRPEVCNIPVVSKKQKIDTANADNLCEGEPPRKKYKEYWEECFDTKVCDSSISYSEADNMSMNKQTTTSVDIRSGHSSGSSDITGVPKKAGKRSGQSNITTGSDRGYVSQPCIRESISSSSNEGDQRKQRTLRTNPVKLKVKPETSTNEEKQEIRRRKMLSLARQKRLRFKAIVDYIPSNEDITDILKEFTIDFLLTEYSGLVRKLLEVQREGNADTLDKSHILWLITYFLKFATQLEIGLSYIDGVLSVETLTYVTYEGVEELEFLELAQRDRETELEPYLRRIHLVVAALREFLQTMDTYKQSSLLSQADKTHLFNLQLQSSYIKGLRQLLLLLIRSFKSGHQGLTYLTDLIVTNHYVMKNMEESMQVEQCRAPKLDIQDHIRQFANMELMTKYGQLLVNFADNPPQVNDSIFTIMHHVAGDLESPHTLFIPAVLQTFSKILEENLNICPDWVDLIEFIIQTFLHTMQNAPHKCAATITENMDNVEIVDECGLTVAETSSLFYNFNQVENRSDPVGAIIDIYRQAGNISLTRVSLIQSLLAHGIITHAQYMSFMYMKSVLTQCNGEGKGSVKAEVGSEHCTSDGHITETEEPPEGGHLRENRDIKVLKDCLMKQGRGGLITWVQEVLLDACRVKLYPKTLLPDATSRVPHEPVAFHCNLSKQSIPLVPFSREQNLGLQTEAFILLLHKLGFLLPADVGKVYPRIPYFWSADHLYAVAAKLGPLPEDTYRFTSDDIERIAKKANNLEKRPYRRSRGWRDLDSLDGDCDDEPIDEVTITKIPLDEPMSAFEERMNEVCSIQVQQELRGDTNVPMEVVTSECTDSMQGFNQHETRQRRTSTTVHHHLSTSTTAPQISQGGCVGDELSSELTCLQPAVTSLRDLQDEPMETLTDTDYLENLDLMDKTVRSSRKTRF